MNDYHQLNIVKIVQKYFDSFLYIIVNFDVFSVYFLSIMLYTEHISIIEGMNFMPLVDAKCTNCGGKLKVDSEREASICEFCGSAFIVEKAINNYNVTNNNTIHAQVVNVYGNDNTKQNEINIEEKTNDLLSDFKKAGSCNLLSPKNLIEVLSLIDKDSNSKKKTLLHALEEYSDKLDFKFDYSYSPNNFCSLDPLRNYNFQSLWKDCGNLGEDGSHFVEWILFATSKLSKYDCLEKVQKKLTEYYIALLKNGNTNALWSSNSNGSIWNVERTSKHEFIYIDQKLSNKFLLPYFNQGLENAKKYNTIYLTNDSNKFIFILGKYAISEVNEYFCFKYDQNFIDNIVNVIPDHYIYEMNNLAKQIGYTSSKKLLSKYGVEINANYNYKVISVSNDGILYNMKAINSNIKYDKGYNYNIFVEDIRYSLIEFRKAAKKCQYCGSNLKGVFTKVCSNPQCGRPKDY